MNKAQGYLTALSQIGVVVNDDAKINYVRNKVIAYISTGNLSFSLQEIYGFCLHIGYDINALQSYRWVNRLGVVFYNANAVIHIFNDYVEFGQLVVTLCCFANACFPNEHKENISLVIFDAVNDCHDEITVIYKDGVLAAYRKGAEILDNPLIFELLSWLPAYKPALKSFETALQQYTNRVYERNCVDNLRHSLEMLVRQKLNSQKSLENLKSDIGLFLKNNNVPAHISNMYETLLAYYTNYQNNYVKHDDKVDQREIEFIMYLTGIFMRFFISISVDKEESEA